MRYAARTDANQSEIVEALRAAGASVWVIGLPVDLLVGFRGVTIPMEVKTLNGKRNPKPAPHTKLQVDFMRTWNGGPVPTVTDAQGALRAIRIIEAKG